MCKIKKSNQGTLNSKNLVCGYDVMCKFSMHLKVVKLMFRKVRS